MSGNSFCFQIDHGGSYKETVCDNNNELLAKKVLSLAPPLQRISFSSTLGQKHLFHYPVLLIFDFEITGKEGQ